MASDPLPLKKNSAELGDLEKLPKLHWGGPPWRRLCSPALL